MPSMTWRSRLVTGAALAVLALDLALPAAAAPGATGSDGGSTVTVGASDGGSAPGTGGQTPGRSSGGGSGGGARCVFVAVPPAFAVQLGPGGPGPGTWYEARCGPPQQIQASIEAEVVDVAARVGDERLAAGDPDRAAWAARRALKVSPYDERLYRILLRCADAAGNPAGVESVMTELVRLVADGTEPDDAVHPETLALYRQVSRRTISTPVPPP